MKVFANDYYEGIQKLWILVCDLCMELNMERRKQAKKVGCSSLSIFMLSMVLDRPFETSDFGK